MTDISELSEELLDNAILLAGQKHPDQPAGFPFGEFDVNAVRLPPELLKQLEDDSDDDEQDTPTDLVEDTGFENVIVVDNLPVVGPEKMDRLTTLLKKIFGSVGTIREGGFHMPFEDENNRTTGYCFIEFETPEMALAAKEQGHNYRLDKSHTFSVCMFDDIDRYQKVPDAYVPLDVPAFEPKENLYSYMLEPRALDQFIVRYKDETEIYWWDGKKSQTVQVYKKSKMTDSFVAWSPYGTHLATAHRQGIAMWGGPDFHRFHRFNHQNVRSMDFSPMECYLVTYTMIRDHEGMPLVNLRIFDIRSGALMRLFQGPPNEFIVGKNGAEPAPSDLTWPLFKWAGGCDDKYFAKLGIAKSQQPVISVYETPDMVLLDKKSLKLDAVQAFEWSPSDPIMCIYQRESGNLPARISLMKIPERRELRQKNLYNVQDIFIHWHPQGDFLAIRVNRHTKTKKTTYYGFELFRIREKDIPMEVLELPKKTDNIIAFAWEPSGTRFVVVHGESPRYNVSFFSMKNDKGKFGVTTLRTLEGKTVQQVYWSPKGGTVVLVGPAPGGLLEFFNVDLFETMNTGEHYMMTELVWDPSGRYVCTYVNTIHDTDNGYQLWTFQGRNLLKEQQDQFFQFMWRPRRPSLLSSEAMAKIENDLKSYSKKYDAEDEVLLMAADSEIMETRNRQTSSWQSWKEDNAVHARAHDDLLREAYGDGYAEAAFEMKTVELQQLMDIKEEPYKPGYGN